MKIEHFHRTLVAIAVNQQTGEYYICLRDLLESLGNDELPDDEIRPVLDKLCQWLRETLQKFPITVEDREDQAGDFGYGDDCEVGGYIQGGVVFLKVKDLHKIVEIRRKEITARLEGNKHRIDKVTHLRAMQQMNDGFDYLDARIAQIEEECNSPDPSLN